MSAVKLNGNDIKHNLRQNGSNLKKFAEQYDFSYRLVSDVVRGINLGKYGKGREILEKLQEVINQNDEVSRNLLEE